MVGANVAAAVLALVALCFVPRGRSAASRPIAVLCLAAAAWSLCTAWAAASPGINPEANAGILAAAASAAQAAYVAARRLVSGSWPIPWPILVLFVAEPITMATLRLLVYPDLASAQFRLTWPFIAHAAYCFGLLVAVILTLNVRQRHPEKRVRIFVLTAQVLVIAIIATEVAANDQSHFMVIATAIFAVWVVRHPDEWSTSRARADSLLNSLGVFLFVFDRHGRLKDWNATADRLIELITGRSPSRELTAGEILGRSLPFPDGERIDLVLQDGSMRTSAHIHQVDPASRADRSDWVVMLRPVRSSVDQTSFPTLSGELVGHDPATQTLNRRSSISLLQAAVETGDAAVRVDVVASDASARDDETMFVVARRLETMFPTTRWGRLSTWVLVATFDPQDAERAAEQIGEAARTATGLHATVTAHVCAPQHDGDYEGFVRRVDAP